VSRVIDLIPGDVVENDDPQGRKGTFIAQAQHPIWPSLRLVLWKMSDGTWSFDALDYYQEIGVVTSFDDDDWRQFELRKALLG
jgi:hypothetical protein